MDLIRVIIVDDSSKFREGLRFYLETILLYSVIAEAGNGEEFLRLSNMDDADVILMDIEMPVLNGIEAAEKVSAQKSLNLIAVSSFDESVYLEKLHTAGFKGYIHKTNIYNELRSTIHYVLDGKQQNKGFLH